MRTYILQPAASAPRPDRSTDAPVRSPAPYPGTSAPLSRRQKWQLSNLAEEAWLHLGRRDQLAGESLEDFRHRVAVEACGKRISAAGNGDYKAIQARFLVIFGESARAFDSAMKSETEGLRIAHQKLSTELLAQGLQPGYAETIARAVFKRPLASLHTKEVWKVFYTIRNRGNAKHGKGNAANRNKSQRRTQD
jgi:hypothetical protein